MSSRRSRRAHTTQPKYTQDEFEADMDSSSSNSAKNKSKIGEELLQQPDGGELDNEGEEVTRCICGSDELYIPKNNHGEFDQADPGFFIQCEKCAVWQHGYCVGIKDEEEAPDKYWCEKCKPQFHTLHIDRFNIRRSKYEPNGHPNTTRSRGVKRKNGRFTGKTEDDEDVDAIDNVVEEAKAAAVSSNEGDHDDFEDEDGTRRKNRKRHSAYNYEEMLKKALEESAKESGVVPEEVDVSSAEGNVRETRHSSLRKARTKSDDENHTWGNEDGSANEAQYKQPLKASSSENATSGNNVKQENADNNKFKSEDGKVNIKDIPKRSRNRRTASSDANETNNEKSDGKEKEIKKKEKKESSKPLLPEDKPFRANIPSGRISMAEMNRRVYSIMDFVSNIQINLSGEEEFQNTVTKMDSASLSTEVKLLKKHLLTCYNDSVEQLDKLTTLLNDWQNKFT